MALAAASWTVTRANGNIRYIGNDHDATPNYVTGIELHRWLQSLQDDEEYAGDDQTDIVDTDSSDRSTDNIITLQGIYNIDDYTAQFIYDSSIIQNTGDDFYDGIVNFGNADVQIQVLQNGRIIPDDFWNQAAAGINPDVGQGISHRFMVKTREAGADIDGRRLVGLSRTFGNTYAEFKINGTARGNNVFALVDTADLNNTSTGAVIAALTNITNTEGYRTIDINNDTVDEHYYSEFNRDVQPINDLFERNKWQTKDPTAEISESGGTPADYTVDNATITAQGQGWLMGANAMIVNKVAFYLKKTLLPTGPITANLYSVTGDQTTGTPNTILEASETYEAGLLTTTYQRIAFGFADADLTEQTAATDYMIVLTHPTGDASNFVQVRGDSAGAAVGGRTESLGAAVGTSNLHIEVFTTPLFYGHPANLFRGITHEIPVDTILTGPLSAVEDLSWTEATIASTGIMVATDSVSAPTKVWVQILTGIVPTDGTTLTGVTSGATVDVNGAATERTIAAPFNGASTGSAIIGSYGYGVEKADVNDTDTLFALEDPATAINPPNNVTYTVNGLVSGDRVMVTEDSGATGINLNQLALNATLNGGTETTVTIGHANGDELVIASDTPTPAGVIRIERDSGLYSYHAYTAIPTSTTFTIPSESFVADPATLGNNVFIAYIDLATATTSEAFTVVYRGSDRTMFVKVRDGGITPIKTAQTTSALGTNGGSATVNRISDE